MSKSHAQAKPAPDPAEHIEHQGDQAAAILARLDAIEAKLDKLLQSAPLSEADRQAAVSAMRVPHS